MKSHVMKTRAATLRLPLTDINAGFDRLASGETIRQSIAMP